MSDKEEAIQLFRALADPTRLALVNLLKDCPHDGGYCVNNLAERLGVSQPAVSQHLRVLRHLGLVHGERRGYRVHYAIDCQRLQELRAVADRILTIDHD
jgi:ArsR family transcriptional regulator, arsenate/arsenite/antimonite-responsive transcriptional repressor